MAGIRKIKIQGAKVKNGDISMKTGIQNVSPSKPKRITR
jgi:hypothetical protein